MKLDGGFIVVAADDGSGGDAGAGSGGGSGHGGGMGVGDDHGYGLQSALINHRHG